MRSQKNTAVAGIILISFCLLAAAPLWAQSRGLKAIRGADMKIHLDFLGAPEFAGRPAPSDEVEIASLYLAREAERRGLKPILPDGSFFQRVPIEAATISSARSRLRLLKAGGKQVFYFPRSFGIANMRSASEGVFSGGVVFIGTTKDADDKTLAGVDLAGKMAVALGVTIPAGPPPAAGAPAPFSLQPYLQEKGAAGLVTVIPAERENTLREGGADFDINQQLHFPSVDMSGWLSRRPAAAPGRFVQLEVRHEAGAAILGISRAELESRFEAASRGEALLPAAVDGLTLEAGIYFDTRTTSASNVAGWIEGTDRKLRGEYVTITGHQDHLPRRDGRIFPGADDNGSGAVAMLELIEALVVERPKRSVIFVWSTAEERGLVGAFHFVQHCPVPVEKISANLNLDMISRNDPGMIYLVGSKALSTELDRILRAANDRSSRLRIDDTYQSPGHPDQFFFRSDQYPHIQYGIPGVWIFCGTTPDYHTPQDAIDRVDYAKMEKVTKFAYVACLDIGNAPAMMKLDVHPDVTTRGAHNMKVDWNAR
jgi:Peptidase family M28